MATVTIGKSYFEALLRRAEFHTNEPSNPLHNGNLVSLTLAEHSYLKNQAREYAILRNALLRGGLTPDTLDLLITGAEHEQNEEEEPGFSSWNQGTFGRVPTVAVTVTKPSADLTPNPSDRMVGNGGYLSHHPRNSYGRTNSFGAADSGATFPDKDDHYIPDGQDAPGPGPQPQFPQNDQRTILFTNLSDKTTHKDVTNMIRGGRLLDVYLRNDRSATVAFVEGAAEFLAYAKRKDLYLHTKRVEVRWNDRQFRLPGHVANKIAMGATRNIVIRGGAAKNLTERGIREDMEHIHNLVVISVDFVKGDVFISTNSVHNALFARTCMMSRALYKGLKIEWYPDECAAPLPKIQQKVNVPAAPPMTKNKTQISSSNLYSLLDLDESGASEGSEQDGDNESQALPGFSTNGVSINWADAAVVA